MGNAPKRVQGAEILLDRQTDLSAHLHTGAVAALPVSVGTLVRLNFPEGTGNKETGSTRQVHLYCFHMSSVRTVADLKGS